MSEDWKKVVGAMAERFPDDFSLGDVGSLLLQFGIDVKPDTLRGQMHQYQERGLLERVAPGRFRATAEGAIAADTILGNGAEPNESADDDEVPF